MWYKLSTWVPFKAKAQTTPSLIHFQIGTINQGLAHCCSCLPKMKTTKEGINKQACVTDIEPWSVTCQTFSRIIPSRFMEDAITYTKYSLQLSPMEILTYWKENQVLFQNVPDPKLAWEPQECISRSSGGNWRNKVSLSHWRKISFSFINGK